MKKVLHIFGLMDKGGAELRTLEVCKALKEEYKFYFLTLSDKTGSLESNMKENGFIIYKSKNKIQFFKQLIKIIQKEKIDVVHSHIFLASGLVMMIAKILKVKIRISHLRSTGNGLEGKLTNDIKNYLLKKIMIRYSTRILGVSTGVLEEIFFKKIDEKNIFKVLYNGFSIPSNELAEYKNQKENYIIHIGRQNVAKNQLRAIHIFNEFYQSNSGYQLLLVGRKNPIINNLLEKEIEKLSLNNVIKILDEKENIYPDLIKSKLLLLPSKREGLPGVVIESVISNTPVLGTDLSGVIELNSHFPIHINYLSLNKDNKDWALKMEEILKKSYPEIDFTNTDFYLENSLIKYRELWR
ncbi:glycosyltransferase [Planococcus kocurii]|uniref:glycosyltransferase n=1 Tax=Planococcus kocurii TaxID=1374 RepID=UPI003D01ED61